ncbi:unnamed protein product [Durusdinium trenchii]|uniref:Uncharacterized protein n=1 Tax=Durusdinium trenchii TaxID=1381693 RepID=A0ABP0JWH7_9DINO
MGSAHEPCRSPAGSGSDMRPPAGRSRSASRAASPGRAAELIASSPERQKLEIQVQLHRSAQQCHEALAISRHLAEAQPQSWEASWLGMVRKELTELDERLSRQLVRLQSQTDRVMEVFVTSLEGKVAQVMSKQPLTDWRLAELDANIKGLQEQLEMQARRGDAADARLQRWRTAFQSELRKLHAEVPVLEEKPNPLEGTDALKNAMLASLRDDPPQGAATHSNTQTRGGGVEELAGALEEVKSQIDSKIGSKIGEVMDAVRSSISSHGQKLSAEVEDIRSQVVKLEGQSSKAAKLQDAHFSEAEAQVEKMLESATESFASMLVATNQQLDAALAKQEVLEEELRRVADASAIPSLIQGDALRMLERLRKEQRLEAAALWEAIGELAEHIGADGASFIKVAQNEAGRSSQLQASHGEQGAFGMHQAQGRPATAK